MKYQYLNTKKDEKILNNYNQFFHSINHKNYKNNVNRISQNSQEIFNIKKTTLLKRGYNIFLTFSKDVLVGTSLFIVASIGLGSIIMTNQMGKNKQQYSYVTPIYDEAMNSDIYDRFSLALKNNEKTEELVAQLKDKNALNSIGKVLIKDSLTFESPLSQAVKYKRLDTVKELIDSGADINLTYDDKSILLSRIHNSFILNSPSANLKSNIDEINITMYLLSKGFNWKSDNFFILKNTANSEIWRNFWINYLTKNAPKFLPTYKEILISQLTSKDNILIDELKWIDNNNFK